MDPETQSTLLAIVSLCLVLALLVCIAMGVVVARREGRTRDPEQGSSASSYLGTYRLAILFLIGGSLISLKTARDLSLLDSGTDPQSLFPHLVLDAYHLLGFWPAALVTPAVTLLVTTILIVWARRRDRSD